MATLNIPKTPEYNTLIAMIEDIMNPSAKTMRTFQEKLNQSELVLLFNSIHKSSTSKSGVKNLEPKNLTKAPRNPTKAAEEEVRCEALVFAYEMNAEENLLPSRCKRCVEENTKFCKQHGAADGKPWKCKERGDIETTHEFKWQHLGTVHEPSPIFELEKVKIELLKNFKAKQLLAADKSSSEDEDADEEKSKIIKEKKTKTAKASKKAVKEPKSKKAAEEKPKKRVANGYIFYKSLNHQKIKEQLIAENQEMKGKELANKITSVASEQWKQLSEAEQAQYKQQAKDSIAASVEETSSSQEQVDNVDTPVAALDSISPKSEQEDDDQLNESSQVEIPDIDDEDTLVFNAKHNVWVDTDNNLCYESKDTHPGPIGQVQRGKFLPFPAKKK